MKSLVYISTREIRSPQAERNIFSQFNNAIGVLSNGISHPILAPTSRISVSSSVSSALFEARRQNIENFQNEPEECETETEVFDENVINETIPISGSKNES